MTSPKEALAFAVLQGAVASGPRIKWSSNDNGILSKAVGAQDGYTASAINVSYSDTGLFGVLLAAPAKGAGKIVESAIKVLKQGSVSDEDVARGKLIYFIMLQQ